MSAKGGIAFITTGLLKGGDAREKDAAKKSEG
jgi:hypothetical protein